MIVGDPFVEPAKTRAQTRHILKTVAEGRDVDNSSGPNRKQVDDLERCVEPTKPFLPNITSRIGRIVDNIGSVVSERANCTSDLRDHHPGTTGEGLIAWREEAGGMPRVSDACGPWFTISTVSQLPQGDLVQYGVLGVTDTEQHERTSVDAELPAPASVLVR